MSITPLNQRDSRWKDIKLGFSTSTTVGSHGCTLTALSILAGITPDILNERLKVVNGFANTNLVIWSKLKEAIGVLEFEWRGYSYDNAKVSDAISKYGGCLVEVDATRIGAPTHWVLFIGNGQMIDPWTGVTKATSYYPLKGYAVIKKVGNLTMPDDLNTLLGKYGVKNLAELDTKIAEHVGTTWGAEDKSGGGYLGSSRREVNKLKLELANALAKLNDTIAQMAGVKAERDNAKEAFRDLINKMAVTVGTVADEGAIIKKITADVEQLDLAIKGKVQAEKELTTYQQEKEKEIADLKRELGEMKADLEKKNQQIANLIQRVEDLEKLPPTQEQPNIIEKIKKLWLEIVSIWKKS